MKGKAILRSLLLAYGVTGLFLLILAFLLFQFEFGGGTAAVGIIIIYVVSCLVGGFMAGKIIRKDRYIYGGSLPGFPIMFCCFWYLFWHRGNGI